MSYFKVICSRKFDATPTAFSFYASAQTEARHRACFDDSITIYVATKWLGFAQADKREVERVYRNQYPGWHVDAKPMTKAEFDKQPHVRVVGHV